MSRALLPCIYFFSHESVKICPTSDLKKSLIQTDGKVIEEIHETRMTIFHERHNKCVSSDILIISYLPKNILYLSQVKKVIFTLFQRKLQKHKTVT